MHMHLYTHVYCVTIQVPLSFFQIALYQFVISTEQTNP